MDLLFPIVKIAMERKRIDFEEVDYWKSLGPQGFDNYCINKRGFVFNTSTGKYPEGCINSEGYLVFHLIHNDGKQREKRSHRLVIIAFKYLHPDSTYTVDHINRDKLDNRLINLRWASKKEQTLNRTLPISTIGRGVYQFAFKLGSTERRFIKKYCRIIDAERETGVDDSSIVKVCKGKAYYAGENRISDEKYDWWYAEDIEINPNEIFRDYISEKFDGIQVSNLGRVKHNGRLIGYMTLQGYFASKIKDKKGKEKHISFHKIIVDTFYGLTDDEDLVINHIDGNKGNDNPLNLERTTISGNSQHAHDNKLTNTSSTLQYNADDFMYQCPIRYFPSIASAERYLKLENEHSSHIWEACIVGGNKYTANGFRWRNPEVDEHFKECLAHASDNWSEKAWMGIVDIKYPEFIPNCPYKVYDVDEMEPLPDTSHIGCRGDIILNGTKLDRSNDLVPIPGKRMVIRQFKVRTKLGVFINQFISPEDAFEKCGSNFRVSATHRNIESACRGEVVNSLGFRWDCIWI